MSKIKLLPESVYCKIAAGEVVERPFSVVKELVENSFDAGASSVTVEIKNGGIDGVYVSDDGCGIEPDDVKTAFLPHATGKITSFEDIYNLSTLGFRGEALPSIAAVARVTLSSRPEHLKIGAKYSINGGIPEYFEEYTGAKGTHITVTDLFYNLPARAKFLKSGRAEENEITSLVSKLILSKPDTAIKYSADGKTVYHSAGQGLKAALLAVYGADCMDKILPLDYEYKNIRISGFVGRPEFAKPNRTYGAAFINGRYAQNYAIGKVVADCYGERLMKRRFPFYALNVDLNKADVDVNAHPNKLEVRFSDFNAVASAVSRAVSAALDGGERAVIGAGESLPFNMPSKNTPPPSAAAYAETPYAVTRPLNADSLLAGGGKRVGAGINPVEYFSRGRRGKNLAQDGGLLNKIVAEHFTEKRRGLSESGGTASGEAGEKANSAAFVPQSLFGGDVARLIGAAFETYILVERGDCVLLVDQHAAHERVIYDRLAANLKETRPAAQDLLVPYTFTVNAEEKFFIDGNLETVNALGFSVEYFGADTYRINAVPAPLAGIDLRAFTDAFLRDLSSLKTSNADILSERLMRSACRAAVKGGDKLSDADASFLLKLLDERGAELRCPHGRPIAVALQRAEIERWFRRRL